MAARNTTSKGDPQPQTEQREDLRTEPTIDVVAMPSRRADGTPDQTKGFLVVGEDGEQRSVADVEAEAKDS
ncbi:hypothetical protein N866_07155 [Actinotalea ferrariae CF5-4]|uniref:Uncharacterized protein n=1 Tax=Actinotalea ferrariae CF5-4 TaxID=948458 RepID=A0A021W021_9CELL|nr:hypothetical protein [Actinotalea ferrariae]EYR64672.1 hypothetical protein N866_07155 [Actinotalea ferrariae CF5-4]